MKVGVRGFGPSPYSQQEIRLKNTKGKSGLKVEPNQSALVGDTTPEIRGTATSSLTADELSHIRGPSPTFGDSSPWGKRKGSPGKKEDAQAR